MSADGDEEVGEVEAGDGGILGPGAVAGDDDGAFVFFLERSFFSVAD